MVFEKANSLYGTYGKYEVLHYLQDRYFDKSEYRHISRILYKMNNMYAKFRKIPDIGMNQYLSLLMKSDIEAYIKGNKFPLDIEDRLLNILSAKHKELIKK